METITRRVMLQALAAQALAVRVARGQTTRHQSPKPLSPDAVTHDWRSFLGPTHDAVSTETHLSRTLPPPRVWEFEKGTGYTSPAISGDHLVFFHRVDDRELVECLHAETGASRWQFPLRHSVSGSLRLQQRAAIKPGHRPGPCLHAGG